MNREEVNKLAPHPLQTHEWGEFRKAWGNEVIYTPHGLLTLHKPPFTNKKVGMLIRGNAPTRKSLTDLKKVAAEQKLIFIKLEPFVKKSASLERLLKTSGCVKGKTLFTPTTFWIDLTKSEESLLKSFSGKTRYNIRLAQKKGVAVTNDNSGAAFDSYIRLTRGTVKRQRFYAHSERYHRLMWGVLNKAGIAKLLVAKYKNEIIAAWILFAWKGFLYYPYGASTSNPNHSRLMPSNLLMWEAIRLGRKLKLKTFDLWGREEGKGFTKFKEGYTPEVVEFIGTWDLVTSKLYWPYRFADYLRWRLLRIKSRFTKPSF
ncbi:MAG: FemAB family protein [Candidatus Woesebacteria bacterium GW2011_GWB1_43_14]|uniref:FemAB family protein n=1 Tax=Candidatus Woesebacteria bacterium GW2011_GWB1_43_14 TaxID=1618578 RepID=A0A0G1DID4_9BACT|nr:MAG: FemAB family protein [Candidatus Woesebacteria bacterium GW2011_GWA1_39_11b]KKS77977.1 MAG: FemAB family protein [Candidatus Woesebacteria bacterium GW2011_GWC1_42_9]KKS97444.1 MAG: FemAB family protein [Candidatus Woesebacteria bacterium GW2011_GWB1_43_14]